MSAYCATLTGTGDANDTADAADVKPGKQKAKASDPQSADKNKSKKR